ncbi:MAG: hypothetical protein AAB365_01385 [Patescibacteria group bacterium]
MKIIHIIFKVILCLILLSPVLGVLGVFPPPTPDLYNTPEAFAFIETLMASGFIIYLQTLVFVAAAILIFTKRTALAMLLILPITLNIVGFHLFLDGGLFTAGAIMGNVLFLLNVYFLWKNRQQYKSLWEKSVA